MGTSSTGAPRRPQTPARRYQSGINLSYAHGMGIQLDDFDKRMIVYIAGEKQAGRSVYAYLFGALLSSVDLFVAGQSEMRDLETMYATVKLLDELAKSHSPEELREIADGTREITGEDVHSGQ